MMKDRAIIVENISKLYRIGTASAGTLKETFNNVFAPKSDETEFWALKNVSFELNQGEVLGVVGRNGAGKSTLLKILSRITEPSSGRIEINGRMGSLLEVGTGFHPELTGRENIFLNGSILGMKRSEIKRQFDEIVEFSGVGKFIDTPVKRYSSGMYVRLAFAVAAHLEPEILVIDEVLAVGDVAFQKKCMGKMHDIAGHGRTVLFVSHNMQAVRSLCTKAIYLQNGMLVGQGKTSEVLDQYDQTLRAMEFSQTSDIKNQRSRRGSGSVRFNSIQVVNALGVEQPSFEVPDTITFKLGFVVNEDMPDLYAAIALRSGLNREVVTTLRHKLPFRNLRAGESYQFEMILDGNQLRPGEYPIYLWLGDADAKAYDVVDDVVAPLVISSSLSFAELGYDPSSHSGYFSASSRVAF